MSRNLPDRDKPAGNNVIFQSPFSNLNFSSLKTGDFFFHPLAGDHSPAIKVVRKDRKQAVVDLNLQQQNGRHLPTLVECDDFQNLTVVAVEAAVIRPKPGLINLKNGAAGGSIDRAALVVLPTQTLLKVRGPNLGTLAFDISTGQQVDSPDSAQCLWASEWQIIIRENEKDHVLFERND
jgi:hypothetical protein